MLPLKYRQNKMRKLEEKRRAYLEQLMFLRQFRKDEDGGLIVLTLLLLISMLVVGGMAVDFMRFEAERTKLQSVSDRAVLAAANLNQSRPPEDVITDFFAAEGYAGAIIGDPDIDKNDLGSTIRIDSRVDVNTFYLRLVGIDSLSAPATASAVEGTGNVEVSLILDISGSMGSAMTGQANVLDADGNKTYDEDGNIITEEREETRMFFLQQAANQFVEDLLKPEYEDRVSINLVAYSQHVRLGEDLYTALRTTPDSISENGLIGSSFSDVTNDVDDAGEPGESYASPFEYTWVDADGNPVEPDEDGNLPDDAELVGPSDAPINVAWANGEAVYTNPSRCVTFTDAEYNQLAFNTTRTYTQVEYADVWDGNDVFYERYATCPPYDYQGTILLSQDVDQLKTAINALQPTLNTSIHRGMKWGISLLDPSMRDLIGGIPTIDEEFRGIRPADYGDGGTKKYVVIMTDGNTVTSDLIKRAEYGDDEDFYDTYEERVALSESTVGRWVANDDDDSTTYDSVTSSIGTVAQLNTKLKQMCDLARPVMTEVYTISMGVQNQTMTDCASKADNAFQSTVTNEPGEPGLDEIFSAIAAQITALRLSL
ncbi:MAG: pilus assembly protein TadG-related protein [Pseudomonadota bacterium]